MSIYYYFKCNKCNKRGGFFSRQAWGWGNFDIIDSFKFLAFHTSNCGEQYIGVISEHNDDYEEELNSEILDYYTKESVNHFPFSDDWKLMNDNIQNTIDEINAKWIVEKTKGIEPDNGIKVYGIINEVEYEEKKRGGYAYKALFISDNGQCYTLIHIDRNLPLKDNRYYILGEVVTDEYLSMFNIGETRGPIIMIKVIRSI